MHDAKSKVVLVVGLVFIFSLSYAGCGTDRAEVLSGTYVYAMPNEHTEFKGLGCAVLEVHIERLEATLMPVGYDPIVMELELTDESQWDKRCEVFFSNRLMQTFRIISPDTIAFGEFLLKSPVLLPGCNYGSVGLEGLFEQSNSEEDQLVWIIFQDPESAHEFCN